MELFNFRAQQKSKPLTEKGENLKEALKKIPPGDYNSGQIIAFMTEHGVDPIAAGAVYFLGGGIDALVAAHPDILELRTQDNPGSAQIGWRILPQEVYSS